MATRGADVRFWGVERTSGQARRMSANDPKRTFGPGACCHAKWWSDPIPPVANPCC